MNTTKKNIEFILILILNSNIFAQLELSTFTDKYDYQYGEQIELFCKVTNNADTTFEFLAGSFQTCQAEFSFNGFNSWEHTACLTMSELLTFKPHTSKIYSWKIDPMIFGLPNNDGEQMIIGKYYFGLVDTIYINAPQYLGGQVSVGFLKQSVDTLQKIKDSLNVTILDHSEFENSISELWQIDGYQIDSLISDLQANNNITYIENAVFVEYDNIVDENPLNFYPLHIGDKWFYSVTGNQYDTEIHPFDINISRTILKDTIMNNGIKYFEILETRSDENNPTYKYERIDSAEYKVYTYNSSLEDINHDLMIYDFSADIGDTIYSNDDALHDYFSSVYLKDTLMHIFDTIEYGRIPTSRVYSFWSFGHDRRIFSPQFGLTRKSSSADGYDDYWVLKAAFIRNEKYGDTTLVGVSQQSLNSPNTFSLSQNYPNPFNPSTTVSYSIPSLGNKHSYSHVQLRVYDILGCEVATLINKEQSAGSYQVHFDAGELTSGIYFYRLQYGNFTQTKKMILLR